MLCQLWEPPGPSRCCVRAKPSQHMQGKGRKWGRKFCLHRAAFTLPCQPVALCPGEKKNVLLGLAWEKRGNADPALCTIKNNTKQLDVSFAKGCTHRGCPWVDLELWVLSPCEECPTQSRGIHGVRGPAAALGEHRLHVEAVGWKIVFCSTH